ncbi:MAG: P-II family nitrogen regulator [Nitrospirae bacterium]|nr:P-II family nitrogen regulator [Nitrospirota bacterium]
MKEIIAVIRPHQALATRKALEEIGITAYTTFRVLGRSRQGGLRYPRKLFRRSADIRFLPKRLFEVVVDDYQVEAAVSAIIKVNQTGRIGDGKLFILPVSEVCAIRTGERDKESLR